MRLPVKLPATTANLGPGFDCLGLALDLWNETEISLEGNDVHVVTEGEGAGRSPTGKSNLIVKSMLHYYKQMGIPAPPGFLVRCRNDVPFGSGLGSSSTAILAGLLAANSLCDSLLNPMDILGMAAGLEGHPDNSAAALFGGLVIVSSGIDGLQVRQVALGMSGWKVVFILPKWHLETRAARAVLPLQLQFKDAVFNISRTALLIEAFHNQDIDLLAYAMQDRLHQPYRLGLIPGAEQAIQSAQTLGCAAALSGAGPGLVAFCLHNPENVAAAMAAALKQNDLQSRTFILSISQQGALVNSRSVVLPVQ